MTKNAANPSAKRAMTTRTMASCAMLVAIQVILARAVPMLAPDSRISLEAIPIVLAGMLFGPLAGGMVGFSADFVGSLFSGYGYNPLFCLPPILYGLFGGLFRFYVSKKTSFWRVLLTYLFPVLLGSLLWQSFTLAYVYNSQGAFIESLLIKLSTRGVQFAIVGPLEAFITYLLLRSNLFRRSKLWPLGDVTKS